MHPRWDGTKCYLSVFSWSSSLWSLPYVYTLPCVRTAEHAWYMIRGPLTSFTHYSACASFFFTCCLSVSAAAFCMLMICCAGTLSSSGNPCCAQRAAAAPACANLYLPGIQSHTPHLRGNDISVITVWSVMQGSNSYALWSQLCQEGVSFVHVSIEKMATASDVMGVSLGASCVRVWLGSRAEDSNPCAIWPCRLEYVRENNLLSVWTTRVLCKSLSKVGDLLTGGQVLGLEWTPGLLCSGCPSWTAGRGEKTMR